MISSENTVVINRQRSEVFAFVADHENDPKWRRGVLDVKRASGDGVGAIYRQGIKGPFGRRIPADFEITAYEEGSDMAFRALSGPVRPEGSYRFEDADGGTRVTFSLNADIRGPKVLMTPMVAKAMNGEVRALEELKRVLES